MSILKRRALVLEDEMERYEAAIRAILPRDAEWDITTVEDVERAIATFRDDRAFDLLVVDYELPDTDSTVFLRQLRRQWDDVIPVLLLSQYPDGGGFALTAHREFNALQPFISKSQLQADDGIEAYERDVSMHYNEYMAARCSPQIHDEYGRLESVIVHSPSDEIECIDPDALPHYLFESVPRTSKVQAEHADFIQTLRRATRGAIVLDVARLLFEVVRSAGTEARREIVENILLRPELRWMRQQFRAAAGDLTPRLTALFDEVCSAHPETIVRWLLRGINAADFLPRLDASTRDSMWSRRQHQIVEPTSNLYFTRDPAFVLGSGVVLSKMHWPIRRREPSILREIFARHPFMVHIRHSLLDLDAEPGTMSIEGGDVMAIGKGEYVIAESERTSRQAVRKTGEFLIRKCGASKVYQPSIPAKRAFIHLDTVCSLAGPNYVVVHPEALETEAEVRVWTSETIERGLEPERDGRSLLKLLSREMIPTAKGGPGARHEQFDDATNVFMASPETAIAYDRNPATNEALQEHIEVMSFMGDDLVLGRGGPRCMTMPLRRRT